MSHGDYDKWIWLGLGAFFIVGVKTLYYQHQEIRRLSPTTNPPKPRPKSPKIEYPEDGIPHWALATLATHPNHDIRSSATKIVLDRWSRIPNATQKLYAQAHSSDAAIAYRASTILAYLTDHHPDQQQPQRQGFDTEIELTLDDTEGEEILRVIVERAPELDRRVTGVEEAVPENAWQRLNMQLNSLVQMEPSESQSQTQAQAQAQTPSARLHEESPEEARLRRRRREAMVLNEDGGPLTQDNIIQRQSSGLGGMGTLERVVQDAWYTAMQHEWEGGADPVRIVQSIEVGGAEGGAEHVRESEDEDEDDDDADENASAT